MLKQAIKSALDRSGIYFKWKKNMPHGINWMLDIDRISKPGWAPTTILDVGANIGQTALELARHWSKAQVHAFEPVSSSFATLCENVRHLPNVHCHKCGLGDNVGELTIQTLPNNEQNSLVSDRISLAEGAVAEIIAIETIDHLCSKHVLRSVDLLKTDTEGYDRQVLLGASSLLESGDIPFVLSEVSFLPDDPQHTPFAEVHSYLISFGFIVIGFYDSEHLIPAPKDSYCNALYAHPNVLRKT